MGNAPIAAPSLAPAATNKEWFPRLDADEEAVLTAEEQKLEAELQALAETPAAHKPIGNPAAADTKANADDADDDQKAADADADDDDDDDIMDDSEDEEDDEEDDDDGSPFEEDADESTDW